MIFSKVALILASVSASSDGMMAGFKNFFGKKPAEFIPETGAIKKFLEKNRSTFFNADLGDVKNYFSPAIDFLDHFKNQLSGVTNGDQISRSSAFILSIPDIISDIVKECKTVKDEVSIKQTLRRVEALIAAFIFLNLRSTVLTDSDTKTLPDVLTIFKDVLELAADPKDVDPIVDAIVCEADTTAPAGGKSSSGKPSLPIRNLFANLAVLAAIRKSETDWTAAPTIPDVMAKLISFCPAKDAGFSVEFSAGMERLTPEALLTEGQWKKVVEWIGSRQSGSSTAFPF